jgi:hypothetical protein
MNRPHSILLFERLYLIAWMIGVASTIASWQASQAMLMRNPAVAEFGPGFLFVTAGVQLLLPLTLWYLVARRGSVVAKWLLVALFVIGLVALLSAAALGTMQLTVSTLVTVIVFALQAAAIAMLFRADARGWFVEGSSDADLKA